MGYIGNFPTAVPLSSNDLNDGIVTAEKLDLTDDYAFTGTVSGAGGVSNVNTVVITTTSTYTPTSGTSFFKVYVTGAGGGGGGLTASDAQYMFSAGGNGGDTTVKVFNSTEMGASASITIGSGGSAGGTGGTQGSTGGNTTFNPAGTGGTITGYGGKGGHGVNGINFRGGMTEAETQQRSASTAGGDYIIFGEYGYDGRRRRVSTGNDNDQAGAGGRSFFGAGASDRATDNNGDLTGEANGTNGGGGGGCIIRNANNTVNKSGGAGANGVVVIEEYA